MRKRDLKDKQAMQAAVRQVADEYLKDPNINSVGVGYKVKDGQRTGELALQFTVGQKVAPEGLEAVTTRPIPQTIEANGIKFTTDVVEREFRRQPVAVESGDTKPERKRRIDPMVPGVSVGHVRSTAGTFGCLVNENESGQTRMLSNWHVLHGETGELGDSIVQPGPFDDNRVETNTCGKLVRSFLGLAGDCAIASIVDRMAGEEILGLDVPVRRVGDPELDDVVVKSGRTTDVTYGVVTRIHTITELDYGAAGVHEIGSFEIGPEPDHPAANNEISMGGDSGSAWMAVGSSGDVDDMMLGLHFAGETNEPAEYALACYASSVFEKLEISPLPPPSPDVAVAVTPVAQGYDRGFLPNHAVDLPAAGVAAVDKDYAPTKAGDDVRHYTHFSLAMSARRRFCRWVAWNIDGNGLQQLTRSGIAFKVDDAYDAKHQVDDSLYSNNPLDRGHIARRADLLWGSRDEAERANLDSFFFTNITPQLDDFNQSSQHGLWGELENAVFEDVDVDNLRVSVFGGPIFSDTDLPYREVLVPRRFWKVVAYVEGGTLKAKAFVLTQDNLESRLESLGLEPFKLYQVTLADLEDMTELNYGQLVQADTMPAAPEALGVPAVRRIEARSQIAGV